MKTHAETLETRIQAFIAETNLITEEIAFRTAVANWVNGLTVEEKLTIFQDILHIYPYQELFSSPSYKVQNTVNAVLYDILKELSHLGLNTSVRPH